MTILTQSERRQTFGLSKAHKSELIQPNGKEERNNFFNMYALNGFCIKKTHHAVLESKS